MVGLGFGQALEDRHLLGVGAVASAGHLEDEWELRESRLMEDGAKALLADLALADVGVTVAVGAEAGHRVVAVDDLDPLQADDLIQLVQRARSSTCRMCSRIEGSRASKPAPLCEPVWKMTPFTPSSSAALR